MTLAADHRALVEDLLPERVEALEAVGDGWDCFTYEVNGSWIVQLPRDEKAAQAIRRQRLLLSELWREVSVAVPVPEVWSDEPVLMAYRKIDGEPLDEAFLESGAGLVPERLGRFLYDLHLIPVEVLGLRPVAAAVWRAGYEELLDDFRARVFPLLEEPERAAAQSMFDRFLETEARFATALHHGDLGPAHILRTPGGDLAGVIDWGDAVQGDPARDFGWVLFAGEDFGERALGAYGGAPDQTFRDRARFYHRIGPWHEVTYGLDTEQPSFVHRGLDGIRERLV